MKKNDMRESIRLAIEKSGRSVYELSSHLPTLRKNTIYRYLRGEIDLSGSKIDEIMNELGIRIRIPKKSGNDETTTPNASASTCAQQRVGEGQHDT